MAEFYVVHWVDPKLTPEQKEALKKSISDVVAKNPAIKYDGIMWDAPAPKDVEDILTAVGAPFDAIIPCFIPHQH